jgi:hypothetical protein
VRPQARHDLATADGAQPDRTSPFEEQKGKWERYYEPPPSQEGAYMGARLFREDSQGRGMLGNRLIMPGLRRPRGDLLRGWTDITHPGVRISADYTNDITEKDFRAFQERVRGVEQTGQEGHRALSGEGEARKPLMRGWPYSDCAGSASAASRRPHRRW